jgi:hypothetical protein
MVNQSIKLDLSTFQINLLLLKILNIFKNNTIGPFIANFDIPNFTIQRIFSVVHEKFSLFEFFFKANLFVNQFYQKIVDLYISRSFLCIMIMPFYPIFTALYQIFLLQFGSYSKRTVNAKFHIYFCFVIFFLS